MPPSPPIAIVGLGAVFPGSPTLDAFWSHILAARSLARQVPAERWPLSPEEAYAPDLAPDKVYSTRACFVEDFRCDPEGLALAPELLSRLDPLFHILLRAGRAAWRDAVTDPVDKARVGVIIGNIALPTDAASALTEELLGPLFEAQALGRPAQPPAPRTDPLNRYVAGLPAGILAKALGLRGGGFTLDAACASSLYALKLAADELRAGRADVMLTGGVSRPDCLYTQMGFSQLHALSPSGNCAPFDAAADGLVVGEGAGILVLKRLEDALRHGDHIYATLAGVGLSNDIGGNLMQPESPGQVRAMRAAYQQAGWTPAEVDLVECHGTGTPVGDATEFASLREVWGDSTQKPCVLGSVKSNVGHLLTAAGAAGLIKVLLAMREAQLPPTANFTRAAPKVALDATGFRILQKAAPWPRPERHPRRAAVSGFGFGGINAHVLLEAWEGADESTPARAIVRQTPDDAIAIVGMGAAFGPWKNLRALAGRLFGERSETPMPPARWWGAPAVERFMGFFVDDVAVPVGRFRIPPAELADMLPQQLLMLQVAADALADAGLGAVAGERLDTGVFIGIGLDLNTTNFRFRWTLAPKARRWARDAGLVLNDAELQRWTRDLRDAAGPPLTANRTMGALGGIVASRVARAFHIGGPSFTISSEETSGLSALEVAVGALRRGELKVALAGAVDLAGDLRAVLGQEAAGRADAGTVIGEGAGAVVLKRLSDALREGDRVYAVIERVGASSAAPTPPEAAGVVGRAEEDVGHAGAAMGVASLVKAALCLYHELLPRGAEETRYWLRDRADGPRRAQVRVGSVDGNCRHVLLRSVDPQKNIEGAPLPLAEALFAVRGKNAPELLEALEHLAEMARRGMNTPVRHVARAWHRQHSGDTSVGHAVGIVAADGEQLRALIAQAQDAVRAGKAVAAERLFYAPEPLGDQGTIAFVFPGAGNAFPGMGHGLGAAFPEVLRRQDRENERLASQFGAVDMQDGGVGKKGGGHQRAIFSQVALGTLTHDVLGLFGVKPAAVVGYSLGETTGLFATRAWGAGMRDEMLRRMRASTLFTRDLAGRCEAARTVWGLPEEEAVDWRVGVVDRPAAAVRAALEGRRGERVYLLIVNTPAECVIGGHREAVEELVRALGGEGCAFHPVEEVTSVHCAVARPVEGAYRALHLLETVPPEGMRFYSGAAGAAYALTREAAAESIVRQAVGPFDFTKVIEAAYADGARLFIEMGPGASCSRMIGRILGQRPHMARSVCVAGAESETGVLLRVLAQLIAEGVAVDLGVLYGGDEEVEVAAERVVRVRAGGEAFKVPAMPRPVHRHVPAVVPAGAVAAVVVGGGDVMGPLIEQMAATQIAHAQAQEAFLRFSRKNVSAMSAAVSFQMALAAGGGGGACSLADEVPARRVALDRAMCLEFAVGSVGKVLGEAFAEVDNYPTRVRLPDEPLMLVDRIVSIEGEAHSMTSGGGGGRVVTEHDIREGAWYLENGRIPTCIAVEAGQADLFLSGYLGIDAITRGKAVYRLLDAVVTFHAPLPRGGERIVYDITIDHFFRQGETHLFRFHFDATVDGKTILTMRNGCAGFFTEAELAAGQGIVLTAMDKRAVPVKRPADWRELVPMGVERYSDEQVEALRHGDLAGCFGAAFAGLGLTRAAGLPGVGDGGRERMKLVDRVLTLEPEGGRFGMGRIVGEADIHPDDWFLTCHFVDDRVMPGTLMYECCLHTLRIYLLRMGWVGEAADVAYEPRAGMAGQLKCRGQVTGATKKVQYEVVLKEIGYEGEGTPYVVADALMYADGRAIVQMTNMSLRLSGWRREGIERVWEMRNAECGMRNVGRERRALFDAASIRAFAVGNPSAAFGERYRMFDIGQRRKIARLPGPPFQFLDRIVAIEGCEPWKLAAGGMIEAEYDVPADAWYFGEKSEEGKNFRIPHSAFRIDREMPFAVLLEAALQPCGWLAAYVGSALASDVDMRFRNLGGSAVQLRAVGPEVGTLTTRVKMTSVAHSGGMLIQHFEMAVRCAAGEVYRGTTYFGFFSGEALANQVGIRDAARYEPSAEEVRRAEAFAYPEEPPFPGRQMRMVDRIEHFDLIGGGGGAKGLGFIRGSTTVDREAWFFKAHFFEDPVWPGSLGLESFLQLLKVYAYRRWGTEAGEGSRVAFETMALGEKHTWVYRGQVVPTDGRVTVEAMVTAVDDDKRLVRADGFLSVDGRVIYQMKDFAITMRVLSGGGE